MYENRCVFQAYATVVSAAEGKDPDAEDYGKVDELKQYPLFANRLFKDQTLLPVSYFYPHVLEFYNLIL